MKTCHGAIWPIANGRSKSDLPWQTCHVAMVASWQIASFCGKHVAILTCHGKFHGKFRNGNILEILQNSKANILSFLTFSWQLEIANMLPRNLPWKQKKQISCHFHSTTSSFWKISSFKQHHLCCFLQSHPLKKILFVIEKKKFFTSIWTSICSYIIYQHT